MFRNDRKIECEEIALQIVKDARDAADGALMRECIEIVMPRISTWGKSDIPKWRLCN